MIKKRAAGAVILGPGISLGDEAVEGCQFQAWTASQQRRETRPARLALSAWVTRSTCSRDMTLEKGRATVRAATASATGKFPGTGPSSFRIKASRWITGK